MRLRSRWKDWRRRRALARAGVAAEIEAPTFAAGARSGTWVVAAEGLGPASVVWSFGVGDNIAWDLALIERFGCTVHAFDPTPRARAWLATQRLPERFVFHPLGIAARDGEQAFAPPAKARDVNYRPLAAPEPGSLLAPVRRLASLARELGTTHLDVLKLDVEGGEYAVLEDLLATGPLPSQLLVEFHHGRHGVPLERTLATIAALRARGYRILDVSPRGLELTFLLPGSGGVQRGSSS
ncbi:MAG TPA: FkbM family methyltransferase [Planctomycetota bacterium]